MSLDIGFNRNAKQDASYLFSSLPGNSNANLNFLSDYTSIKNGSYKKLLKAYYSETASEEVKSAASKKTSTATSADSASTLSKVESAAGSLKEAADKLSTIGTKSLFNKVDVTTTDKEGNKTTTKGYDTDAIYSAAASFVDSYNSLIKSTGDVNATSITNKVSTLTGAAKSNSKLLEKVGITINSDNTLSIDKEKFTGADMSRVKSLFNGSSSFAYKASAQASLIDYAATNEANKANTYSASGTYSNNYSSGSILSLFS